MDNCEDKLNELIREKVSYYYYNKDENTFYPKRFLEETNGLFEISIKPLSLNTISAIANKTAEIVVTYDGNYNPEYEKIIKLYHILKESCGIQIGDFDEEEMFKILISPLGQLIEEEEFNIPFLHELEVLITKLISYRKAMYLHPYISKKV